ncbi:MAG: hypothetical protein ACYTFT_10240, partial [Planctomycetota bacterium]
MFRLAIVALGVALAVQPLLTAPVLADDVNLEKLYPLLKQRVEDITADRRKGAKKTTDKITALLQNDPDPALRSRKSKAKDKKAKDFASLDAHQWWKLQVKKHKAGKFRFVRKTVKGGKNPSGASMLLTSSKTSKDIDKKYADLAPPADASDVFEGTFAYDKKKDVWTFTLDAKHNGLDSEEVTALKRSIAGWVAGFRSETDMGNTVVNERWLWSKSFWETSVKGLADENFEYYYLLKCVEELKDKQTQREAWDLLLEQYVSNAGERQVNWEKNETA